jgi:hypothetical protein
MLRMLGECINDIACGNIFKPFDRIANSLVNCVFHLTHYFKTKYPKPGENIPRTLREQYVIDSNNYLRRQGL